MDHLSRKCFQDINKKEENNELKHNKCEETSHLKWQNRTNQRTWKHSHGFESHDAKAKPPFSQEMGDDDRMMTTKTTLHGKMIKDCFGNMNANAEQTYPDFHYSSLRRHRNGTKHEGMEQTHKTPCDSQCSSISQLVFLFRERCEMKDGFLLFFSA